jgi:nucleoid-associated protein YgaU
MNRRFHLVLSIIILMGIQPVFAQEDASAGAIIEEDVFIEVIADGEDVSIEVIVEEEDVSAEAIAEEQDVFIEVIVEEEDTSAEAIAGEKAVRTEKVIDMELASDAEFTEALKASSDVELVNKNSTQPSGKQPALTEKTPPAEKSDIAEGTSSTKTEQKTSGSISNNEYLQESQRLASLAEEAYHYGDYDASAGFAESAIRAAELSDEYVAQQMGTAGVSAAGTFPLPASYTIRAWSVSHDCFWNIAGRPWVYGNPHQWRVLYNANKAKLPDPNNPNLIEPGIILDIPSLKGEVRQGAWDKDKTYKPLQ